MSDVETGFDGSEEIGDADLVLLTAEDGSTLECVLLAVLEHEGASYAVLTPHADLDEDGELMIATYEEDEEGLATFGPLDDDAVLEALQAEVGRVIGLLPEDAPSGPALGGPIGEA